MKIIHFSILLLIINVVQVKSQNIKPEQLGFKEFTLNDEELGQVNYYVTTNLIGKKKPILLYLDGSGPYPLFQFTRQGVASTVAFDFKNLSKIYHIVLISKPSVPFIDSVKMDPLTGIPVYLPPIGYKEKLSLEWRVNSAKLVLNQIMNNLKVDAKKVAVLGVSEGFQVGSKLAAVSKNITHLALLVGNGLNQFYDFIIQNRSDAVSGRITDDEAQKNIDSLLRIAGAIYTSPNSHDKEWNGHTYLRWSSFTNSNPTENILSLKIPVYIVAASNDRNSSVLSTDYLKLESVRQKKSNISYKVYSYDHFFNASVRNEKGEVISVKNHMQEVLNEAINWITTN